VRSHLSDGLLRGVGPESRHFGQPDHGVFIWPHGLRGYPVQLLDLPIQKIQPFQKQLQHLPMQRLLLPS
jgi:hypothetical protein